MTGALTTLTTPEQVGRFNAQCLCYASKHLNARIPPAALDATGIGEVNLSLVGELLLRQASLVASAPYVRPHYCPPIAHGPRRRRWAYIL